MLDDLSLHMMDIAENSTGAGASRVEIRLLELPGQDRLVFSVEDDGRGMDEDLLRQVHDPFCTTRTTRRVGLGIPFLKQAAEACGGGLEIVSKPGEGTRIEAVFGYGHIDRPPLGDIGGVLQALACEAQTVCVRYAHQTNGGCFAVDTDQLQQELGDVPLAEPAVLRWLRQYTNEQVETLTVGG